MELKIYNQLSEVEKIQLQHKGITEDQYNKIVLDTFLLCTVDPSAVDIMERKLFVDDFAFSSKSDKIQYPVDAVNRKIWKGFELDVDNKYKIFIPTVREKRDAEPAGVDITFMWDNDELIPRKLSVYDKMLCGAIATLYEKELKSNVVIPVEQIYKIMGGKGRPTKTQITKIIDHINTLRSMTVKYSNVKEYKHGQKIRKIKLDSFVNVLYAKVYTAKYKGNETSVVVVMEYPAMFKFAKEHNSQIETIPSCIMCADWKQSDTSAKIFDYIIGYILYRKGNDKMMYTTLCDRCEISDQEFKKNKSRYLNRIDKILDHVIKCGWKISSYKHVNDGVLLNRGVRTSAEKVRTSAEKVRTSADDHFPKRNTGKGLQTRKKP